MKAKIIIVMIVAIGISFVGCEKEHINNSENEVEDTILQPAFDETGATYSLFTIAPGVQVHFSRGILQYKASTNTWRFAEHQYDHAGRGNSNVSSTYNGWIDLFCWATSGFRPQLEPWMEPSSFWVVANLTGNNAEYDWAWHNAISNGGNQPHMWRTLSADEWNYLFKSRENAYSKYGTCELNGITGIVVLPDNWNQPKKVTFNCGMMGWHRNIYTLDEWAIMESAGAVFLPGTGYRTGTWLGNISNDGAQAVGYYWSTTWAENEYNDHGYYLYFDYKSLNPYCFGASSNNGYSDNIKIGKAVRPIRQ